MENSSRGLGRTVPCYSLVSQVEVVNNQTPGGLMERKRSVNCSDRGLFVNFSNFLDPKGAEVQSNININI